MNLMLMNMRNVRLVMPVLLLCLNGAFAGEWKSQPLDIPAPVLSATQNKVLASFNGQVFELPPADSVWKIKLSSMKGAVLAADSFHYFEDGTVIAPDLRRFPDLSSIPDECCGYRIAEDANRFYLRGLQGQTYYSEKSGAGWKPISTSPPSSQAYQLIPFPNHYLMAGDELSISRNRGATWEKVEGLPGMIGSSDWPKKIGNELFVGYTYNGVFRSADGGLNWSQMFSDASPYRDQNFNGVAISGDTIWLSATSGHMFPPRTDFTWSLGILRSVDSGMNWEWHHQGLPNQASGADGKTKEWYPTVGIHHFAGELWTTMSVGNGNGSPFRSRDGGITWQSVAAGLNRESSYHSETIGNEIRQRGSDEFGMEEYYAFDKAKSLWVRDTLLSSSRIRNLYSLGDTVYGQGQEHFQRKTGPSGQWEKLFPIVLGGEFKYYPSGTEFIGMSYRPIFRLEHSDDGGKTWSSNRPFLPQTRFQNRKVEARGKELYWPDDSLFTPPKLWHAFDDPIHKLWNWQDGVLVQSGSRLFHAAQAGGAWREISLPDTNLAFIINENRITGYSPTQVHTLIGMGPQWNSRKAHFPMPRIVSMSKSRDYLFYIRYPQSTYIPQYPSMNLLAGFIRNDFAIRAPFTFPNHESSVYACSSYVLGSNYNLVSDKAILDTVNYAEVPTYFYTFQTRRVVRQSPALIARALFADADMMATAHDGGRILYSKNRGKTWNEASSPHNITSFAGNAEMLFAAADSVLHRIMATGAIWTSSSVLPRKIKQVSGSPSFLAIITQDNQIQVTTDTAGTWTTLPALPPGQAAVPTAIAAYGNEVFIGTQEHGIFGWSDGNAVSIRQGAGPETAKRPLGNRPGSQDLHPIPRGWIRIPGQPGQSVNAKGQSRRHPPASAGH